MSGRDMCRLVVAMALSLSSAPAGWAQPLEVATDPAELAQQVDQRINQLVAEISARDPGLAEEIERQGAMCVRDLGDGQLDQEILIREIENVREVREVMERAMLADVEARITEIARVNPEAAEQMRAAFEAFQAGGGAEMGRMSEMGLAEAKGHFEQAYGEAIARGDTAGAEQMKTMFEAAERGEFAEAFRPSPEMMERMHGEMQRYLEFNPEMREYAEVAWDGFVRDITSYGEMGEDRRSPEEMARQGELLREMAGGGSLDLDRVQQIFDLDPHEADMLKGMSEAEVRTFLEGVSREDAADWEHFGTEQFRDFAGGPEAFRDFGGPEAFRDFGGPEGIRDTSTTPDFSAPERVFDFSAPEYDRTTPEYIAPERNTDNILNNNADQTLDRRFLFETPVSVEPHIADHNGDGFPEFAAHETWEHTYSDNTKDLHIHHNP